jgi:hypothetical protein
MMDFHESNDLYANSPVKLFSVSGLDIPFSDSWRKIGINLSGGADSACLLMLLCDHAVENKIPLVIHVITHIRCWNTRPWQETISKQVYDKFVTMFPSIQFVRHVNFIPPELEWGVIGPITTDKHGRPRSGDQIAVSSYNEYITHKERLDSVFNATSANPQDQNWEGGMQDRNKLPSDGNIHDLIFSKNNSYVCHPFKFVDKSWIIAQFYKARYISLYNATRSCEGDITNSTIASAGIKPFEFSSKTVPKCGVCWWCNERSWAEAKLQETLKDINE